MASGSGHLSLRARSGKQMSHTVTDHPARPTPSGEKAAPQRKAKLLPTDKQEGIDEWTRSGNVNTDSNTTGPAATPPDKDGRFLWEFREAKTGSQAHSLKVLCP